MGHACCAHQEFPRRPERQDHPVTAVVAVLAIVAAVVLIGWARVALHGLEAFTVAAEDQAATSRWATGFSH